MEPAKLGTVMDWPYPTNQKELSRFLGYLNFYRKFIDQFSALVAPLTTLTQDKVDTVKGLLSAESHDSFERLKLCFKSAPLLQHFNFEKARVLHVDSSKYALLAVLSQRDATGQLRPVSFLLKKWTHNESSWQCHDQELGAIVQAFIEWRAWLIDTQEPVEVFSDHANLKYFTRNQHLLDRQTRWAAYLSSFYFVIKHVPGKLNPADPPTRRPDFLPPGEIKDSQRVMIDTTSEGLKICGSSLDKEDPRLDIGEVTLPDPASALPAVKDTDARVQDVSFCPPLASLKDLLTKAYSVEPPDPEEIAGLELRDGFWWLRDRLYVPLSLRSQILQHLHDNPTSGHPGTLKTLDLVTRTMTWPGVRGDVLSYFKSCFSCQRAKHSNQRPPGQMIPLSIPDCHWSTIGIDFVVKLPVSGGFDSILVIVDHLSKGVHLIAANESWNAEEFASNICSVFNRLPLRHGTLVRMARQSG
ncbi:hypothetical protein PCASD_25767 [Puccinia coronata f. sp. avenae]|uniref:Integrase catalytic domain-containing protein n=1 Tax=Puccinia coronata f. sp. avenae TaxID=200324 RepID=A0A2N5TMQ4_9BASI|nr:hypothetical protein PCASD_25767 [Puccinia coronata f. sp. avenae]